MKIVDFHMHIGFERSTFENDICLLQLSQNVKANPNIAPAAATNIFSDLLMERTGSDV